MFGVSDDFLSASTKKFFILLLIQEKNATKWWLPSFRIIPYKNLSILLFHPFIFNSDFHAICAFLAIVHNTSSNRREIERVFLYTFVCCCYFFFALLSPVLNKKYGVDQSIFSEISANKRLARLLNWPPWINSSNPKKWIEKWFNWWPHRRHMQQAPQELSRQPSIY